jgi:hypothetical protein
MDKGDLFARFGRSSGILELNFNNDSDLSGQDLRSAAQPHRVNGRPESVVDMGISKEGSQGWAGDARTHPPTFRNVLFFEYLEECTLPVIDDAESRIRDRNIRWLSVLCIRPEELGPALSLDELP